jgi:purine-binding chemotaxis protein CheW
VTVTVATQSRQLCTFVVGGLTFGVDVERVQEVIRAQVATRVPLAHPVIAGLINLRGQIVTAFDLRERLGMPPRPTGQEPMNVVIRDHDGGITLLVDAIGDVVSVEPAEFEPRPDTVQGSARELIIGAYKTERRLLLELDVDRTLTLAAGREDGVA